MRGGTAKTQGLKKNLSRSGKKTTKRSGDGSNTLKKKMKGEEQNVSQSGGVQKKRPASGKTIGRKRRKGRLWS